MFVEGEDAPRALVPLGQEYDYRQAYFESRKAGDPYLSPHGLFRRLEPGYHRHAFEFMQKFGTLFIHSTTRFRGESLWVNLSDFWNRHARFVAVAKLWEDRFDPSKLVADWADIVSGTNNLTVALRRHSDTFRIQLTSTFACVQSSLGNNHPTSKKCCARQMSYGNSFTSLSTLS